MGFGENHILRFSIVAGNTNALNEWATHRATPFILDSIVNENHSSRSRTKSVKTPEQTSFSHSGVCRGRLNANAIVNCTPDPLLRAQVALRSLDRNMA